MELFSLSYCVLQDHKKSLSGCLDLEGSPLVAEAPLPPELQEVLKQLPAPQLER